MNNINILAFIKAVDKEFFDSFINKGHICMNTAKWFRDYEKKDNNIGDAGEGAITACGSDFTISVTDTIEGFTSEKDLKDKMDKADWSKKFSGKNLRMFDAKNANILSLYAITFCESGKKINGNIVPKKFIDEFSNHRFILIINPKEFISRIKNAIDNKGKLMQFNMIEYYPFNKVLKNNLTFFHKQDIYNYQKEFRLIFENNELKREILDIGSLSDICTEIDLFKQPCIMNIDGVRIIIKMGSK